MCITIDWRYTLFQISCAPYISKVMIDLFVAWHPISVDVISDYKVRLPPSSSIRRLRLVGCRYVKCNLVQSRNSCSSTKLLQKVSWWIWKHLNLCLAEEKSLPKFSLGKVSNLALFKMAAAYRLCNLIINISGLAYLIEKWF